MRSDSPAAIMGALGLIEDEMAELLPSYALAAGELADFEAWERREYLAVKSELKDAGKLDAVMLGVEKAKVTETLIKDTVQHEMHLRYSTRYDEMQNVRRAVAYGNVLFKGQDARRSIGQSLLKRHSETDHQSYGQGAHGQAGR